ncbi:hypothetical protein TNCV_1650061 [Trichonephila clavipes]|nr:hypothetical protein TNCV_1650061 [Trichonephila clavipes]
MNKVRKTRDTQVYDPEEFVVIDDENVCTAMITIDKDILEFVKISTNVIDADSNDKNEMNNAAPDPMSSEMRDIMKNMLCLDAHSNGEMNNKIDDIELFVGNLILKCKRKTSNYFSKTQ